MRPRDLKSWLKFIYETRLCGYIEGPPGLGKSALPFQVYEQEMKMGLIEKRLLHLDPIDLKGFGHVDVKANVTIWSSPNWLPGNKKSKGVIFLDELPLATPAIVNGALQLMFPNERGERKLDEFTLPEGWIVLGAGNRLIDKVGANKINPLARNRMVKAELSLHPEDIFKHWIERDYAPEVIYYNRWKPDSLFTFDPKSDEFSFCTPRSWEFVSRIVKAVPPKEIELDLFLGCISKAQAYEFAGFCQVWRDLPNPKKVIEDPMNAPVPADNVGTLIALCGALARMATRKNFENIVKYANRLNKTFAFLLVRDAENLHGKEITETAAYIQFQTANKDYSIG
jgi:hypothetical protein